MAERGPLGTHLRDAIRLNRARRAGYRRRGGLRAGALSRVLVGAERALLPLVDRFDREAARLGLDLGAPLADLSDAPDADTPLPDLASLGRTVSTRPARAVVRRALRAGDLDRAGLGFVRWERTVRHAEARSRRHRALERHVLESAATFAAWGAGAARRRPEAGPLVRQIVRGHLPLLPLARALDRLAAPVHRRGAGLFVNDLPPIPLPPDDAP